MCCDACVCCVRALVIRVHLLCACTFVVIHVFVVTRAFVVMRAFVVCVYIC